MKLQILVVVTALLPGTKVGAQRQLDLTGKPEVVMAEPFTLVSGVRELPGGLAVVTDQMDRSVFLANFTTRESRRIGRQGDGPGEYRFPMAPLAGPANTTWIHDASLLRTLVLSAEGVIASALPTPAAGLPGGLATARGTDRSGGIYFEQNSFDQQRGRFLDSVAVVRWRPSANRTDVIARVWSGGRVMVNRPEGQASMARSITPFPHLDAWAARPNGGIVIIRHDPFRIDVVEADGVMRQGGPIEYTPLMVTRADREAYRKRTEFQRSVAAGVAGAGGQMKQGPRFPDDAFPTVMPPFIASAVAVTPEGEIWIGRSHAALDKTWRYDIFDAAGKLVGAATLNNNATVVGFGTGSVYVARTNPNDDLVYLERHRR